uniref:Uncharacterized protein n=1 Tax=Tanacetum cinerariifolium TaxID=118510 RepID=A0A699I408_TANCI|nr:hypothetical protein [Tanacetum cinerariifolium]
MPWSSAYSSSNTKHNLLSCSQILDPSSPSIVHFLHLLKPTKLKTVDSGHRCSLLSFIGGQNKERKRSEL